MLPIYLDVPKHLIREANKEIYEIIEMFLDSCNALDFETLLQEIFPPFLIRKDIEKCKLIIYELKEMSVDSYVRNYLKPIYEYPLFMLLEWYIEVSEELIEQDYSLAIEVQTDEEYLTVNMKNFEEYKNFMFEDWDFLDIPELFSCYQQTPLLCTDFFHVNLKDYIELMPDDIKEEYENLQVKTSINQEQPVSLEDYIIKSIYSSIRRLEHRPIEIQGLSETTLSNYIETILSQQFSERNICIRREEPAGFARKQTGELDFYIFEDKNHILKTISVGENKEWGKYEESIKQLIGYMDDAFSFGFIITFNKNTQLQTVLNKRREILKSFNVDGNFGVIGEIDEITEMRNVLKTKHENPERKDTYFIIYHFIINVFAPERKLAASQARSKKTICD